MELDKQTTVRSHSGENPSVQPAAPQGERQPRQGFAFGVGAVVLGALAGLALPKERHHDVRKRLDRRRQRILEERGLAERETLKGREDSEREEPERGRKKARSGRARSGGGRGRTAEKPGQIPKAGWRDILVRTWRQMNEDNLPIIAAGVAFYLLLGAVPTIAAAISIWGIVADPAQIQQNFNQMATFLPEDARNLLSEQISRIAGQSGVASLAAVVSILIALWGAGTAMKALINALNIVYEEEESRSFARLSGIALLLSLFLIAVGLVTLGLIIVVPMVLAAFGLEGTTELLVSILRWPVLFIVAMASLGVIYRYAPDRDEPQWRWLSWGAAAATVLWIIGSGLFSWYVSNFGNYNETYGSLGAVVILMLWLYLSAFAVLLGAELNAEMEHQTGKDTTKGEPQPMGDRAAHVADHVADSPE
jgi:membrane protein